jgi:hypothetical protein
MRKYNFIWKPLYFIFSLLFATWLVWKIEQISPSDFGVHQAPVMRRAGDPKEILGHKQYLMDVCFAYKTGIIDSVKLDRKLTIFLNKYGREDVVVK